MTPHERLTQVRRALLDLHKALIDGERAEYEQTHGVVTPGALLQLLIRDPQFSWLHQISALIVRVDELASNASDRRRATPGRPTLSPSQLEIEAEIVLRSVRDLLSAGNPPAEFWRRYGPALQRDPAVVLMHEAVMLALAPPDDRPQ